MYSALRRLTTFIVIAGQYLVLHKKVPADEFESVCLMVIGKNSIIFIICSIPFHSIQFNLMGNQILKNPTIFVLVGIIIIASL